MGEIFRRVVTEAGKLKKKGLKQWARQIQLSREKKKQVLTERLAELTKAERDDENLTDLVDMKINLNFEIEKDESYCEQRARINWLKFGDKNTSFFHSQALQRRKTNFIHKLQNEDGKEMMALQKIEDVAQAYFQRLFSTEGGGNYDHLLSGIKRCVNM